MIRLLAFSDIHGAYGKTAALIEREQLFDGIIIGGDLTTVGTPREAQEAVERFQVYGKPLFVVAGNMDPPELDELFERLNVLASGKGRMLGDVGIFGVSGAPFTPMNTPYEISEEAIRARADAGWKEVQGSRVKIFVPHAPPHGTKVDRILTGRHVGSLAVRQFVEAHQPDVVVCGHVHEARGLDRLGKTQVVNCGPAGKGYYAVIELGEEIRIELKG